MIHGSKGKVHSRRIGGGGGHGSKWSKEEAGSPHFHPYVGISDPSVEQGLKCLPPVTSSSNEVPCPKRSISYPKSATRCILNVNSTNL